MFHITETKHNIVRIAFITNFIPTIKVLNKLSQTKDKYIGLINTSLTFFQRLIKQHPIVSKFYPFYNHKKKHLKQLTEHAYVVSINQVHQYNHDQSIKTTYV